MIAFSKEHWQPRPFSRSLNWFREFVETPEKKPYDHGLHPHVGAPGGPCDALDDPRVLSIWLQWGSRLGKTFFGQAASMFYAETSPRPLMFATSDNKLALEVVQRTYRMIENCKPLRPQLLPPHRRKQSLVQFANCRMYVAWARSVSTLADKPVRVGHANEIDKWEHEKTSKEADPLKLFSDRFKEFPTHKKIYESTPTVKGHSRIERGRLHSSNCQYYVPCPHCGRYQVLKMDRIEWEKDEGGRSDRDLARRTAFYRCNNKKCHQPILDQHRIPMIRLGVWVPEGCKPIDKQARLAAERWPNQESSPWGGWGAVKWVKGTPRRDGPEAGYQLSSLYALSLGWGEIAAEFVSSKTNPQDLRNFVNQWLAETWEITAKEQTWEQLGDRLISSIPPGIVPDGFTLVTIGCDQQDKKTVYVVNAWNSEYRSHTLAYGEVPNREELIDLVFTKKYQLQNGVIELAISMGLFDSGFRASQIYDFCAKCCRQGIHILPCKGANVAMHTPFKIVTLGENTARPGAPLVHVDTITTQDWIEGQLHDLRFAAGDPGAHSVYSASKAQHQDYLEQLLNETSVQETDSRNYSRETWQRISDTIPNDYRDAHRYSYVAMLLATKGRGVQEKPPVNTNPRPQATRSKPAPAPADPPQRQQQPIRQQTRRPSGWQVSL